MWGGYNIDDIYDAFAFAETGSFENPWIRNTDREVEGGSTAFGPVQVTLGLLEDYRDNESAIFQDNQNIGDKLINQANLFNYYGNEPHDIPVHPQHDSLIYKGIMGLQDFLGGEGIHEAFDYGGQGTRINSGLRTEYKDFAQDMMLDMWNKNKNKDNPIKSFIQSWRGVPEDEDPDYYKRFNTYLGR